MIFTPLNYFLVDQNSQINPFYDFFFFFAGVGECCGGVEDKKISRKHGIL